MTDFRDDWLHELERLSKREDDGLTSREWAARMGVCHETAKERLRMAHEMGWLRAGRRTTRDMSGRRTNVPVYLIERPDKEVKK